MAPYLKVIFDHVESNGLVESRRQNCYHHTCNKVYLFESSHEPLISCKILVSYRTMATLRLFWYMIISNNRRFHSLAQKFYMRSYLREMVAKVYIQDRYFSAIVRDMTSDSLCGIISEMANTVKHGN